ncbi:hypothetical protein ACHAWU_008247 [Discostella pseudostelligera]|uniref:Uncharacterized protein n=1 Tax=Discostella pseudostelligera TaxID=259834 RepID=A0ABD3M756_9STRA
MYHLRPAQGVGKGLGSDVSVVSTGLLVGVGVRSSSDGLLVGDPLLHTSSYGQLTFAPNDSLQQVCMFSNTTSSFSYFPLLVHFSPLKYHLRPPSQASQGVGATVSTVVTSTMVGSADIISGVFGVGLTVGTVGVPEVGAAEVGSEVIGAAVVGSTVKISGTVGASEVGAAEVGSDVIGADVVGDSVTISGTVGASEVGAAEVGSEVIGAAVVGDSVTISGTVGASEVGAAEVGSGVIGADVITSGVVEGTAVVGVCSVPIGLAVDGLGVGELAILIQTSSTTRDQCRAWEQRWWAQE